MANFKLEIIDAVSSTVVNELFFSAPTRNDAIKRMYVELQNSQNHPLGDGEYYAVLYRFVNGNYIKDDTAPYPAFKMEDDTFIFITDIPDQFKS